MAKGKKGKKKKTEPIKKPEALVYIGPSRPGGLMLIQGTVYRDGLPDHVSQAIEAYPVLDGLFVPVACLGMMRKKLRDPQSAISVRYRKAAKITT